MRGNRLNHTHYDCTGRVLNEWKGVGDSSVHSSEVAVCAPV